ncbi:MAG: AAA family ATPase [Candidatus Nitrosocosmicus sp.]|nr:AAA family ATPase [Candidatus Nitrosocosmicus sp.]
MRRRFRRFSERLDSWLLVSFFFDEFDAIALQRKTEREGTDPTAKMMSQILTEMDGIENLDGVFVIGATNRIDLIDGALLRPGRFDRIIEIPVPSVNSRRQIVKIHLKKGLLMKQP